ncbi:ANK [Seminavis robusta]|uniref:ANK n=1 Tax=Seminavis robusta TaxID=568900 RepID=A0A9N8DDR8_9STRA|nr:ANK [Seminavis robusta]|eukprot:Sro76_g041600.1 ANK (232) ;mRNA; f:51032-51727
MCCVTMKRPRFDSDDESSSGDSFGTCTSRKKIRCIMSELPERMHKQPLDQERRPDDTLQSLTSAGVPYYAFDSQSLAGFFYPPTAKEIKAYDHTVLNAVRQQDYGTLRALYSQGRPLKCSNAFGESLLHLACRKGMYQMTRFLVDECHVPLRICDDFGRTPLADACWTAEPNFDLIDFILEREPDLLFIKDRRGSTPLGYVRRPQWKLWNQYLQSKSNHQGFFQPRVVLSK